MYRFVFGIFILMVCNIFGQGNHRFKFSFDKGLLFEENTTTVEYYNAAPVTKDASFSFDKGYAVNFQYLQRMFDFGPGDNYREDFDMAWLVDLSYVNSSDISNFSFQGGASVEISWFQFQSVIGYTLYSDEIVNPGYDATLVRYSWYDESPTLDLSGFTFTLAMLLDVPIAEVDMGQIGIIGGIRYVQVFGGAFTERLGLNIGLSLVL